jgi:hypothetical protein
MMLYNVLCYCCVPTRLAVITLLLPGQPSGNGDPGLPGGDPDLPNAPLDGGIYLLFALLVIYGMYKIRSQKS